MGMKIDNIGSMLLKGPSFLAVLFFFIFILSMFFFTSTASAWWSTGAVESVHEKISSKAFDLVSKRLVNRPFLKAYRTSIVGYTTTAENDVSAHGDDNTRNGGNIALWFNAFTRAYNENWLDDAAEYLGYCLHLIEDMNVPAHAFNIPHYQSANPVDFDNFEFMADELLNKLATISLPDMDIAETDQPDDPTVYYARAREATETRIFSEGFSKYWHLGGGPDWNGDGPQGYYSDQTTNEDIFPKLYSNMSQQETDFLFGQLSEGVRYVGLFLLAVDRISQYRVTVGKKFINKGDGLVQSDDGAISCGETCSGLYYPDAPITLRATPSQGSLFEGWTPTSLNCGTSPTCSFTVDKKYKVKAIFRGPYRLLTKIKSKNEGSGSVTADISGIATGISCPAYSCEDYYPYGNNVVLTAQPGGGSQFMGWKPASLGCGTNLTCTLPMTKKQTVTAIFEGM
jgi:hypothetical protein